MLPLLYRSIRSRPITIQALKAQGEFKTKEQHSKPEQQGDLDESGFDEKFKHEYARARSEKPIIDEMKVKWLKRMNLKAGLKNKELIAPLIFEAYTDEFLFNP